MRASLSLATTCKSSRTCSFVLHTRYSHVSVRVFTSIYQFMRQVQDLYLERHVDEYP
jgi:hypothetical protein